MCPACRTFHAALRVEGRDSRAWRVVPETECSFAARLGAGAAGTCGMCRRKTQAVWWRAQCGERRSSISSRASFRDTRPSCYFLWPGRLPEANAGYGYERGLRFLERSTVPADDNGAKGWTLCFRLSVILSKDLADLNRKHAKCVILSGFRGRRAAAPWDSAAAVAGRGGAIRAPRKA
jgi:hypothetical protein